MRIYDKYIPGTGQSKTIVLEEDEYMFNMNEVQFFNGDTGDPLPKGRKITTGEPDWEVIFDSEVDKGSVFRIITPDKKVDA